MYSVSSIIDILKFPCMDAMRKGSMLSSLLLSIAIYTNKDNKNCETLLLQSRNPFHIKEVYGYTSVNVDGARYVVFNSIEEGIKMFVDNCNNDKGLEGIHYNLDIKKCIHIYSKGDLELEKELLEIVDCYKLNNYDNTVLYKKYDGTTNFVEIEPTETFLDVYYVKRFSSETNAIFVSSDKDEAIKACTINGYSVFNSKGQLVFSNRQNMIPKHEKLNSKAYSINIGPGVLVSLKAANLFKSAWADRPLRSITGDFYLYDGKNYNDRYRICKDIESVGKDPLSIIGYVTKKSIQ